MSLKRTIIERILGDSSALEDALSEEYQRDKNDETRLLYNDIIEVLTKHKATWQNTLAVLEMVKWSFIRAKYVQLMEGAAVIPEGSIPLKKDLGDGN